MAQVDQMFLSGWTLLDLDFFFFPIKIIPMSFFSHLIPDIASLLPNFFYCKIQTHSRFSKKE